MDKTTQTEMVEKIEDETCWSSHCRSSTSQFYW